MTSDKVVRSKARQQIDFALGTGRTSLGDLKPKELTELLREALRKADLREIRGFKRLEDLLGRSPGSQTNFGRKDPTQWVEVPATVAIVHQTDAEPPVGLGTHAVKASRGALSQVTTYCRYESDEETTDRAVALEWGGQAWVRTVTESILILRRPNDHSGGESNLFRIEYTYDKVPHKDRMIVTEIRAKQVRIGTFQKHFPGHHTQVARDLIWALRDLAAGTQKALESQAARFQADTLWLDRLGGGITE